MLIIATIASTLLFGSTLAAPLPVDVNAALDQRAEYWGPPPVDVVEAIAARAEYWAPRVEDASGGATAKRAALNRQCKMAAEGIYCSYSHADIAANGAGDFLYPGCAKVESGIDCFFAGAKAPET